MFPTSDCLKAAQRIPLLVQEIANSDADIICLQEVDNLPKLLDSPIISRYSYVYATGDGKKHGCLILYKRERFTLRGTRTIYYDEQLTVQKSADTLPFGSSIVTNNIGLLVGLQSCGKESGFVVATTHLFWHPKYEYERARQAFILVKNVDQFQEEIGSRHWPAIIAGDFNCEPQGACYALLTGSSMTSAQIQEIEDSRVIHKSKDRSSVTKISEVIAEVTMHEQQPEEEKDPDKVIVHARACTPADGLISASNLASIYQNVRPLQSAYSVYNRLHSIEVEKFLRHRWPESQGGCADFEPIYTSYTYFWKNTIDYIFYIESFTAQIQVLGIMQVPSAEELEPGLPQSGVSGSDHVSLRSLLQVQAGM